MSQFAAQEGNNPAAQQLYAGDTVAYAAPQPKRRSSASAFRLLTQRLKTTSLAELLPPAPPDPAPVEMPERGTPAEVDWPAPDHPENAETIILPSSDEYESQAAATEYVEPETEGLAESAIEPHSFDIESLIEGTTGGAATVELDLTPLEVLAREADAAQDEPEASDHGESPAFSFDFFGFERETAEFVEANAPPVSAKAEGLVGSILDDPMEPTTRSARLLLDRKPPEVDEFGAADVGQLFARPSEPEPDKTPQDKSEEDGRSAQYRFWEEAQPEENALQSDHFDLEQFAGRSLSSRQALTTAQEPPGSLGSLEPLLIEPSQEVGEVARSLLEIMSLPNNSTQPQERALAADSILHLLHRLAVKDLIAIVERLSMMEAPPPLILSELIHDPRIEVAGPLLERCPAIDDQDLILISEQRNELRNRMIARRRVISTALSDALIAAQDPSTILTLVRNPGAAISHEAFLRLSEFARKHPALQAPLATRADLPAPVAFELFWVLPPELRRFVLSRFLTDSSTLGKILKLTHRMESDGATEEGQAADFCSRAEIETFVKLLFEDDASAAAEKLASLLGLQQITAARILGDPFGEPLTVAVKSMGMTRAGFEAALAGINDSKVFAANHRDLADLQGFFESLSFNKARVLLTYWDWAVLKTGPYVALSS